MSGKPGAGKTKGVNAMATRKKTPEQMLECYRKDIQRELAHWHFLRDHGGQDPFWPDGVNMNLTRNHIIYARRQIVEICEENDWALLQNISCHCRQKCQMDTWLAWIRKSG